MIPARAGRVPARAVVGTALLLGATGDLLVRSPQDPGLNMLLFFAALALGVRTATHSAGRAPSREAWWWMIAGVALASGFVVRASPALQSLTLLGAATAFALPALRAGRPWVRGSGVGDMLEAVVAAAVHAGLGAFRLAADALDARNAAPDEAATTAPRAGPAILRGLLLATPLLLVFGALFMSADPVFADLVGSVVGTAVEEWASHLLVTAILAWLAAGYLTGFLEGTRLRGLVAGTFRRPSIGIVEAGVAVGLVDLLFASFVAIQFRTLFGGSRWVESTPGLTYAEYAREGFGQLAFASALVLPTLLVADWLLHTRTPRERTLFRALGGLQVALLAMIIASAFQRVVAYQDAYGLTESRFFGAVFLAWLMAAGAWFAATVLRGRRERFALPVLLSGFAVVLGLHVANPDAWIARSNLGRAAVGADAAQGSVDAAYLGSLSADAVPTLLEALPALPDHARCLLARRLLDRWGGDRELDWRSWNRAVARARDAVGSATPALEAMVGPGDDCAAR